MYFVNKPDGPLPGDQLTPTLNIEINLMNSERIIRIMAGSFILISLLLGAPASPLYHSSYWLWFTVFVGFNLFQSGLTRFCPAELILWKLGIPKAGEQAAGCSLK